MILVPCGTAVCFVLESRTVKSKCSERGISDVTAARYTEDLQLVASSAQTDQAVISYLLTATDVQKQITKHTDTSLNHDLFLTPSILHPNVCLTVQDCILMVESSGQCFCKCFSAPSSSWIEEKKKDTNILFSYIFNSVF